MKVAWVQWCTTFGRDEGGKITWQHEVRRRYVAAPRRDRSTDFLQDQRGPQPGSRSDLGNPRWRRGNLTTRRARPVWRLTTSYVRDDSWATGVRHIRLLPGRNAQGWTRTQTGVGFVVWVRFWVGSVSLAARREPRTEGFQQILGRKLWNYRKEQNKFCIQLTWSNGWENNALWIKLGRIITEYFSRYRGILSFRMHIT